MYNFFLYICANLIYTKEKKPSFLFYRLYKNFLHKIIFMAKMNDKEIADYFKSKGVDTKFKGKKTEVSVGTKIYINPETGEEEIFTLVEKNISKDYNFHKIWLQDILNVIDTFGNKKILVLSYLLKNMRNEDNSFGGSYRDIAERCGVSLPTVSAVMSELLESNIIKRLYTATYQFNPAFIVRGGAEKRKNLMIKYNYLEDEKKQIENSKTIDLEPVHPNQSFFNFDEEEPYILPNSGG